MSRLALFCAGLFLVSLISGCCCSGGNPYGACGQPACGSCNNGCGAYQPGGYPSAGLYGPGMPATAYMAPTTAGYAPYYPQAAYAPMDALPTH